MDRRTLQLILKGIKAIWQDYSPPLFKNILFHGVHLAGGEPFLNFPLLLEVTKETINSGVYLGYIETNAGWCIDEEDVHDKFTRLYNVGLKRIFISCSPFHAEKIPLKRTLLAIEVAFKVFGARNVIVYMEHYLQEIAKFGLDEPVSIQRWIELYGKEKAGEMFWRGYRIIPGGRAGYRLGDLSKRYPAKVFSKQNCRFEILQSQHAHFDLYGNYIPYFCGGLSIGDSTDLIKFYEEFNLEDLPLAKLLVEGGPYALMQFAKEKFNYVELSSGYVGKCHLCVDIRKHLSSTATEFKELSPREFYLRL